MSNFKIAAAQISSIPGNIEENISSHIAAINKASAIGVSYIFFPELSLTGYELGLAKSLALSSGDPQLTPLSQAAVDNEILIVVGAPLKKSPLPFLGAFIFHPDGTITTYSKINVHISEEKYFCKGKNYSLINIGSHSIANAICADLTVPIHVETCVAMGATLYAAGAFISPKGYPRDAEMLRTYSEQNDILVMLANYPQTKERPNSDGKSCVWHKGRLLVSANATETALVTADHTDNGWHTEIVRI